MIKNYLSYAVAAALLAASGTSNLAFAVNEAEPNNSLDTATPIVIGRDGVEVTAELGALTTNLPLLPDVDFYSFQGRAGEKLNFDIDYGDKDSTSNLRSVDTVIAVFRTDGTILRDNDDNAGPAADSGSRNLRDSYLSEVKIDVSGRYYIGVSSFPRKFTTGGALVSTTLRTNGSYTLIVTRVQPPEQVINIDIKPGGNTLTSINPKAKGNIPVALLSSKDETGAVTFDALKVDRDSLRFGVNGDETSLLRCGKGGEDVNGDGQLDLVCHFENQGTGFQPGDDEGVVRGTGEGGPFVGRGPLKVVPMKRDR
jgi:hypothetical protein